MSEKKKKKKISCFDIVDLLIMIILSVLCIYPFYYVLIYSISDPERVQSESIFLLPAGFSLEVYKQVFTLENMANAFLISVLRTALGTFLTVACCSFLAFLITQKDFVIRKFVYRYTVVTMYLSSGLIPWYLTVKMLGLTDNFLVYILPSAISGFFVILIKTFIEQLPHELEESARLDGAGFLTVFRSIIFPLSKPIIATVAIFSAVNQWNAWTDTFFFIKNKQLYTAQYVLYTFLKEAENFADQLRTNGVTGLNASAVELTPMSIKMGVTMIVILPIMMVYPFCQRYFVKGITLGAVKG